MTEIRCPNCGTRFDRESTDFCPGPDCGFPVDFIEEPEPDDTAEEAILRRPDEPEEHPAEPAAPEQPPEAVAPTQALPAEPSAPKEEPPGVEEPPRERRVPAWAIVAVAAVALVGLIAAVALALRDADPEVAERDPEAAEDPGVADPPDAEPDNADDPEPPPEEAVIAVQVFFVDAGAVERGEEPVVRPVQRAIPHPDVDPAVATNVLIEFFQGPTAEEEQDGLRLVTSGATGVDDLSVADGVFRLRLTGGCDRGGLPVTIADQLIPSLKQFATVDFVKIHDPDGQTLDPDGPTDSIPACLAE